jgi:predicted DNA-binding protein
MSAKSHKKHIDEREHKDITCAVRLPQSLYQSLSDAAKITNSSLSDIMREAIVEKLDQIREAQIAKSLRRAEIEAKVSKLGLDTNSKSKAELDALLDLLEAS